MEVVFTEVVIKGGCWTPELVAEVGRTKVVVRVDSGSRQQWETGGAIGGRDSWIELE